MARLPGTRGTAARAAPEHPTGAPEQGQSNPRAAPEQPTAPEEAQSSPRAAQRFRKKDPRK